MLNECPNCLSLKIISYKDEKTNKFFLKCQDCNSEYEVDTTPLLDSGDDNYDKEHKAI